MAPRSEAQFEAIRQESRQAIVDAALSLFAVHGYEGTSVRMIARQAGVSQGLLYNYFAGKEELLRAIMQRGLGDVRESFVAALGAGDGNPLRRLFGSTLEILRKNRRFWLLFYSIRSQPIVVERLAAEIAGLAGQIDAGLREILSAARSTAPDVDARILFALIDGISQQFVLDPDGYPAEAVVDRALELLGATTIGGTS